MKHAGLFGQESWRYSGLDLDGERSAITITSQYEIHGKTLPWLQANALFLESRRLLIVITVVLQKGEMGILLSGCLGEKKTFTDISSY
ncbi:hypothetical protein ACJX0J_031816, partial [Zea mays]